MTLMHLQPVQPSRRPFEPLPYRLAVAIEPEVPQLRAEDFTRIQEAFVAAHAASTLKTYSVAWRKFEAWCAAHGHVPLPAHPATVCAYLAERADAGQSMNSLIVACIAINRRRRDHELPSPTHNDSVRRVRRGLRRIHGTATRRPAHTLDLDDLRRIIDAIDRTTTIGIRDAAVILLGFASALRVSELAALQITDVRPKPGGVLLHIRESKTDTEQLGALVGVVAGKHPHTDPIAALDAWLDIRGTQAGPLFTNLRGVYRTGSVRMEPITSTTVSDIVRLRAEAAGLPAERITGHSSGPVTPPPRPSQASPSTRLRPKRGTGKSTSSSGTTYDPPSPAAQLQSACRTLTVCTAPWVFRSIYRRKGIHRYCLERVARRPGVCLPTVDGP